MADTSSITTKTGQQLGSLSELQTGDALVVIRAGVPIGTIDATALVDSVTAGTADDVAANAAAAAGANTSAQGAAGAAAASAAAASGANTSAQGAATEAEAAVASKGSALPVTGYGRSGYIAGQIDSVGNILWAVTTAGKFLLGTGGDIYSLILSNAASIASFSSLQPIAGYTRCGYVAGLIDSVGNILWAVDAAGNFYTAAGKVGTTITSQPEGRAAKLRRLMAQAVRNNAIQNPLTIGNAPRVPSASVMGGQQISNGGQVYQVTTGGALGAGAGSSSRGFGIADGTAVLDYIGPQTAPTVTNLTAVPGDLTQSIPASPTSTILRFGGGVPTAWPGKSGGVGSWSANTGINGAGNFQAGDTVSVPGLNISGHFMELITDSPRVCFAVDASSLIGVNFQVSDESGAVIPGMRYFSQLPFLPIGSGKAYIVLDFTTIAPSGNHPEYSRLRRIRIEAGALAFYGVYILPTATAIPIPTANRATLLQIGDSWTLNDVGQIGPGYGNRVGPAEVCGYLTGFDEVIASGIGGTGYNHTTSACPKNFQQRAADLLPYIKPDLITFLGSVNDAITAAPQQAAVQQCIANIRALNSTVPIVFFGVNYAAYTPGSNSNAITYEGGTQAGVVASGDPLSYFLPIQTLAAPYIQGTGNTGAPAGNGNADLYISPITHLIEWGQPYYGTRMAADLRAVIQKATWVN